MDEQPQDGDIELSFSKEKIHALWAMNYETLPKGLVQHHLIPFLSGTNTLRVNVSAGGALLSDFFTAVIEGGLSGGRLH